MQSAWQAQLNQRRTATENIVQASAEHAQATLDTLRGLLDGLVERVETDGIQGGLPVSGCTGIWPPGWNIMQPCILIGRNGAVMLALSDGTLVTRRPYAEGGRAWICRHGCFPAHPADRPE